MQFFSEILNKIAFFNPKKLEKEKKRKTEILFFSNFRWTSFKTS